VLHQQAHDAAQPEVGGLWPVRGRRFGSREGLTNCARPGDAEIMRELPENNNLRAGKPFKRE